MLVIIVQVAVTTHLYLFATRRIACAHALRRHGGVLTVVLISHESKSRATKHRMVPPQQHVQFQNLPFTARLPTDLACSSGLPRQTGWKCVTSLMPTSSPSSSTALATTSWPVHRDWDQDRHFLEATRNQFWIPQAAICEFNMLREEVESQVCRLLHVPSFRSVSSETDQDPLS